MKGIKQRSRTLLVWVLPVLFAACGGHSKDESAAPSAAVQAPPVVEAAVATVTEAHDTAGDTVLVVPASAVISKDNVSQVFVAGSDGIIWLRWVSTGHKLNGNVEVLSGLVSGETIVVAPTSALREGTRISTVTHTQDRAKEAQH